jgi:hypothetical protein
MAFIATVREHPMIDNRRLSHLKREDAFIEARAAKVMWFATAVLKEEEILSLRIFFHRRF